MSLTDERNAYNLRDFAKHLRRHPTAAERTVCEILRNRAIDGARWRRQHPVPFTPYIADFACPQLMLLIELDGADHTAADGLAQRQRRLDTMRDAQLQRLGWRVERFTNACFEPDVLPITRDVLRRRIQTARRRLRQAAELA